MIALIKSVPRILLVAVVSTTPVALTLGAFAQTPTASEQFQKLQETLRSTHASGDGAAYVAAARSLRELLNGSPNSMLQLASAEAFAGNKEDATRSLTAFVRMGQSNEEALKGKQFDAMRATPQYPGIHDAMAANTTSVSAAGKAFSVPEAAVIPEDIDYDPATKAFYITSVLNKEIWRVDASGHGRVFAKAPDDWPMMALKMDVQHHVLWATEVAIDGFTLSPRKDWGRSAIVMYDLKSGRLLHRVEGPAHTALGDMTLTANGDAILSDGDNGGIYRVDRTSLQVARLDGGEFISPQTAAMLPDGVHLLVPDYLRGIGILDIKTKSVAWIPMDGAHNLSGIDGIYLSGRTLIATQNGASPERVVRFEFDATFTHVQSESVIERATTDLGDPTHGVVVDGYFYYIANSGWNVLDEHGERKPGMAIPRALVMRTALHEPI